MHDTRNDSFANFLFSTRVRPAPYLDFECLESQRQVLSFQTRRYPLFYLAQMTLGEYELYFFS